ncbi:MAG: transposase [Nanoarchaeota archaeon]|nr:transposase [Nanoarchaeota archaeon]
MIEDLKHYGFNWHKQELKYETPKRPVRKTYKQPWHEYNLSKTQEKLFFLNFLHEAVESLDIEDNYIGKGRYPHLIQDMIKCMCIKVYNKSASRNIISDLKLLQGFGHIFKVPHFNIISKYMSSKDTTKYLQDLITITSEPLKEIDTIASADATGFSTFNKRDWIDVRMSQRLKKDFKKLHILTGVKSNTVISAKVTEGTCADSNYLPYLLEKSIYFDLKEVSADKGYLSIKNCEAIAKIGATPFIMPKKNTQGATAKKGSAWYKMIRFWKNNESLFRRHYHKRSNVESTFAMIKRNYLPYVRSKSYTGQVNEVLIKIICHNLAVLIMSIFEYGINVDKFRLLNSNADNLESHNDSSESTLKQESSR